MIPERTIDPGLSIEEEVQVTRTYQLSNDKIQGYTDSIEALLQAIYKVLSTEKYEYPIYGFFYGIDIASLIGKDSTYVKIELKRRIQECLLRDERITSVDNFALSQSGDGLICMFDIISIYGNLSITKEVNV